MRKNLPSPHGCVDYPFSAQIQDTIREHGLCEAMAIYKARGLPFWEFCIFGGEEVARDMATAKCGPGLGSQDRPLLPAPRGVHVWPIGHSL